MTNTSFNSILGDFCPKKKFAVHPDNPLTESEFNWLFKNREVNGFKDVFIKVNAKNYLVHVPIFAQRLSERRGA
jgi:hypothetical protein